MTIPWQNAATISNTAAFFLDVQHKPLLDASIIFQILGGVLTVPIYT